MSDHLFLFTGPETYLLRQKVNAWKRAFKEKHGEINLSVIDAAEASPASLAAEMATVPFLSEKRLIFVENLPEPPRVKRGAAKDEGEEAAAETDEWKKLSESLESVPESSVVVFVQPNPDRRKAFYKALVKTARVETFAVPEGAALRKWVQEEAAAAGTRIDASAAEYLISLTGQDCWRLSRESRKLADCRPGGPVAKTDIDNVVVPSLEANIFHFTDALGVKDGKKAIRNLHRSMAAGEDLRQLFYMIVRQFRLILQVQSYKRQYPTTNPAGVAGALGIHPFVARNVLSQISHFKTGELKQAYRKLLTIDTDLKNSRIRVVADDQDELALAVERFILEFCA